MRLRLKLTLALMGLATISACQNKSTPPVSGASALDIMEKVAVSANRCWFKSGDPAFKSYELSPELSSFSDQPRILVVRKGSSDIRPVLVVQASGKPPKLSAFGPMMGEPLSGRVGKDVQRWAGGSSGC